MARSAPARLVESNDVIHQLLIFWDFSKRCKAALRAVRQRIEQEGGQVDKITTVGLLLRSPFRRFTVAPIFVRAACRYEDDWGCWFVHESNVGMDWVWRSDRGLDLLPVPRSDGSRVDATVLGLPKPVCFLLLILLSASIVGLFAWSEHATGRNR